MFRKNVVKIAHKLFSLLKRAPLLVERKQSDFLRVIEKLYEKSLSGGGFSVRDALVVGCYIFVFCLIASETIFITIAVLVTLTSTGVFGHFSDIELSLVLSFWGSIAFIMLAVSYTMLSLFLLLHLLRGYSLFAMLLASISASAFLVAYLIPVVAWFIFSDSDHNFNQLIVPILAISLITQMFLYVQYKDKICFLTYCRRMRRADINLLANPDIDGQILVLSAQDHYVEVTTETGKKLVRMRLREAVEQVGNQAGMTVHRSYWVALSAIDSLQKIDGKHYLLLNNEDRIPVSASKLKMVKTALKL